MIEKSLHGASGSGHNLCIDVECIITVVLWSNLQESEDFEPPSIESAFTANPYHMDANTNR